MIPAEAKEIPGFDGDYLVTRKGVIYSRKWDGPRRMQPFDGNRYCLWKNGQRYQPTVETLLERTFGQQAPASNDDDDLIEDVLEEYGDSNEVHQWAEGIGAA